MTCRSKDIKELLPAYQGKMLSPTDTDRIEKHLSACEDCTHEARILGMLAAEPVPDPGDAFWQAMPGRVFREVQERKQRERSPGLLDILGGFTVPRWAWAAGAIGVVAMVSWFLVRPAAVDLARTLPENGTTLEYMMPGEPVNIAELSSTELDAATQWARNAFAPIREAVVEDAAGNTELDISSDLSDLSAEELDRVYEMLKKKEQDAREKLRGKTGDEKGFV